jgi:NAD(P)-dependent dehydrogenase (short-subunit alcohol dehydrogenase family)
MAASGIGAAVVDGLLAEGMNIFGSRRCIPGHLTTSPPL